MKRKNSNKIWSFIAFAVTLVSCGITGAEYWQAVVAAALFGIWVLIGGVEDEIQNL